MREEYTRFSEGLVAAKEGRESGRGKDRPHKRKGVPLVVPGLTFVKQVVVKWEDIPDRLFVDAEYQRPEDSNWVSKLSGALRAGGESPAIQAVERTDKRMAVVDGQQRMAAHYYAEKDVRVDVWKAEDREAERRAFVVWNDKKNQTASNIVKAWDGPLGDMIRKSNEVGPLAGRVVVGKAGTGEFTYAGIARAVAAAAVGTYVRGRMQNVMGTAEGYMKIGASRARAEAMLELLPRVFPDGRASDLAMVGLAQAAYRRWLDDPKMPPESIIHRLASLRWDAESGGSRSLKHLPMVEAAINKKWPVTL